MSIKLIKAFYRILLKSKLEYRFHFFMEIFINLFTYVVDFAAIWVLMEKFKSINGWNFYQVVLVYNMNLFSYGAACLFFYIPMRSLEAMVRDGNFDSLLIRPITPFTHLLLRQNYLGFLSHVILGIIVFLICFRNIGIIWSMSSIAFFSISLCGAIFIQAAVIIFTGSLNIKFIAANSVMNVLFYDIRSFVQYPIHIYPKVIQEILTFVIPYAFVNFYPARYLFHIKCGDWYMGYELCFGIFFGGLVLFLGSIKFFSVMVNSYQGIGN